jgi:hypothetical protein
MAPGGLVGAGSAAGGDLAAPSLGAAEGPLGRGVLLLGACLALLICGGLLVYGAGRGLDLTDEVFYLIWTRDPNAYQIVYQPFGHLLHPLFQLVGGDLEAYRLTGFAITAGAGAFLAAALPGARRNAVAFPVYGAAAALTIFFPWIVTPSYNSVANVGAMLIIGGVLGTLGDAPPARIAGAVAAGVGLCLAAFGKPPLFAIAVLVILVTAAWARGARIALIVSLALAAALMSLVLAPAEIVALVVRMSASQRVLGMTNTPLALPGKVWRDWLAAPWPLIAAAVAAGACLALRRARHARWLGYGAIGLGLVYVASVTRDAIDDGIPDFLGLAVATIAAGYAGVVRVAWRGGGFGLAMRPRR